VNLLEIRRHGCLEVRWSLDSERATPVDAEDGRTRRPDRWCRCLATARPGKNRDDSQAPHQLPPT